MRKKIIALLLIFAMSCTGAACNFDRAAVDNSQKEEETTSNNETVDKGRLNILRSDLEVTPEEKTARIKAEYLIKNGGYADDDKVVAIIELPDDSVIDRYLESDNITAKSVAEYAASYDGVRQSELLASKQQALISKLQKKGLITGVNYTYTTIANAVAVTTTYGDFKKLENYSGISNAYLSDTFNRMQTQNDASAIVNAVEVYPTGIYDASSVDYTGEGTAVAVLDSGFDCSHSVFDVDLTGKQLLLDEEEISDLISNGKDGVMLNATKTTQGLTLSDVYQSDKIPFAYDYANKDADVFPFDSEHGTHVAGIIGGYDETQGHIGIAPHTQLVLLKVFPDVQDGAETDDILAALEDAVLLNVDAINMSLGSSCGFARESDEELTNSVYDKINASGISLITAASNSYSSGFGGAQGNTNFVTNPDSGTIGSPAAYAAALSVASISGVKSKYLIANDDQVVFFNESNSISGDKNDFFAELYKSLGKTEDETVEVEYVTVPGVGYRVNYSSINVKGKIALVRRGDNTFEDKALQAKNAGAIGCIIYNNIDGDILMSMGKTDHIPTISISKDDGTILAQKTSGKLVLNYKNQAGPFMSDFSSWGPLADLQLKPEITAHGGNIRSSVPGGEFDELSGTSMASPNLCGIVVLIRQFLKEQPQYQDYSWKQISVLTNQMLMSTATIVLNEQGVPYSPRKQGAGLASLFNVVNTKAYLTVDDKDGNAKDKSKIELYDDPKRSGVYEMTFNVVNTSDAEVKYNLSLTGMTESVSTSDSRHVSETGHILDGGITATKKDGNGSVVNNLITVDAGSSLKVSVKYTLTAGDKDYIETLFPYGMYVEGFVKLEAVGEEKEDIDLNVPFLAYYGDWTQAPLFDKTFYEVESEAHDVSIDDEDKLKADYYATTPYGSYVNNYIIPLGQYLYDVDTVAYDEIPASEDHIALSDYLGTIDGIQTIYAGLLRNAKKMVFTITDKVTGEVMFEKEVTNMRKAYSQGGSPIPAFHSLEIDSFALGLTNNRRYEFKMQGYLDYGDGGIDTNIRNSFSFDFYLDNEAPLIKEASYEKVYDRTLRKDRYYINLTVYDNHYVQSIRPVAFVYDETTRQRSYTDLLDNPIPVYSQMGTDNKVRIEITEYLDNLYYDGMISNALGFAIDDYALNTNIFLCTLPGTNTGNDGSLKFTTNGNLDDNPRETLTVSVDEVADLTKYLATTDPDLDEGRDYLKYLTWTSANEKVAVVREGQVRGVGVGTARITVADRWWGNSTSITVRVTAKSSDYSVTTYADRDLSDFNNAPLESMRFVYFDTLFAYPRCTETIELGEEGSRQYISAIDGMLDMYPGEKIKLTCDIEPWYVQTKYDFTYRTTNESTVAVDQSGVVTAVKEGVATITLSASGSNISATLRVNVKSPFVIDDARTLIAYKGLGDENGVVEIPDDEGILYIGPHAFSLFTYDNDVILDDDFYANRVPVGNPYIKKVIVPNGVTEIQQHAFYNCTGLEEVVLPSTIKFLMHYSFYNCKSLTKINLYEANDSKENRVWVEAIGAFAFNGCEKLDNIDLSHVYSIGEEAFGGASSLKAVNLTELRNTGAYTFLDCTSLATVTMDVNGKTKLSDGMFMGAGLTSVDIYEKKQIPAYCFAQCYDLETVNIHNAILSIEEGAFFECTSLTDLTLPDGSVKISAIAFTNCSALATVRLQANTKITLETSVTYDEEGYILNELGTAFGGSKITAFVVDPANTNYTTSADNKLLLNGAGDTVILAATGAEFGDYTLPASITAISAGAFSGTDITTLTISNKDLQIGDFAFAECLNLVTVNFPATSGTLSIGNYAFYTIFTASQSALVNLNNLDKVKTVGDYAFARTAVTNVVIGEGATYGDGAFFECGSLVTVQVGANSTFGGGAFQDCLLLEEVIMPADGGVYFGPACFAYDEKLTTIDLSTMTELEYQVFFGCLALESVELTNAEVIGEYAFAYCSHLSNVNMPVVRSIEAYAFTGDIFRILDGLTTGSSIPTKERTLAPIFETVVLPETLEYIGEGAFATCWKLSEITIPSQVTQIDHYAFAFCEALETVVLPDAVKAIGEFAFAGCLELASINLGQVEVFYAHAFTGAKLTTVDLTEAALIGYGAFANCEELTGEIVANNLELIGDLSFTATKITGFVAPKLAYIGTGAFQSTALEEFTFSTDLEFIGAGAFAEATSIQNFYFGSEKLTDGKINDYAQLVDGALYTVLSNGNIQLTAVPGGKDITVLEVIEGTVRIGEYAGSGNPYIEKIILPDSLQAIGNYAFYNFTLLNTVEFKSVKAPALENYYEDVSLKTTAPGYKLLHYYYGMFGWELSYHNIIDLVGAREPITMILPANADTSGYGSIVYQAYFGKVEDATRSSYIAMQTNLRNFVDLATKVIALGEVNLNHEKLVTSAVTAMNGVTQDYTQYGYTEEEWTEYVTAVTGARARLLELKLENASKTARDVQARINQLPDKYNGEEEWKTFFEQLSRDYNLLTRSDREALDSTRYTAFRASFDSYGTDIPDVQPTNPDGTNPGEDVNVLVIVLPILGGVVVIAAVIFVVLFVRKKKGN